MKLKYKLKRKWLEKMRVFLGLCPVCGKESKSYRFCSACRVKQRKQNKKQRICKIPFCQNVLTKGTQFCNEHSSYRSYYHRPSSRVSFNFCKYCNQLFTAKKSNHKICQVCNNKHMQAKKWASENKEKIRKSQRKHYNKIKDDPEFKERCRKSKIKNRDYNRKYFKEYNKTEKRKESNRSYSIRPENRKHGKLSIMYNRLFLTDGHVKSELVRISKMKREHITPIMITMKRELIEHTRLTKELNNVINCKRDQRIERVACAS